MHVDYILKLAETFWRKVDSSGGPDACWPWKGCRTAGGYGRLTITISRGEHRQEYAHRVAYFLVKGSIPYGKELDHICRNRACVNPAHLQAVTHKENIARSPVPDIFRRANALRPRKLVCPRGHALAGSNLVLRRNGGRMSRRCRQCEREREKTRRDRRVGSMMAAT